MSTDKKGRPGKLARYCVEPTILSDKFVKGTLPTKLEVLLKSNFDQIQLARAYRQSSIPFGLLVQTVTLMLDALRTIATELFTPRDPYKHLADLQHQSRGLLGRVMSMKSVAETAKAKTMGACHRDDWTDVSKDDLKGMILEAVTTRDRLMDNLAELKREMQWFGMALIDMGQREEGFGF